MPTDISSDDVEIIDRAKAYARALAKKLVPEMTNIDLYPPDLNPVSVFMAGSPGAGKTEASKALLNDIEGEDSKTVCIDPDELRYLFPEYSGDNAALFQPAISILVDKIHDRILKNAQNFLLDGTLSHYRIAKSNIERSLKRNRFVQILYVYQEPAMAWEFVKIREKLEGRRILPNHFVEQYFAARKVVNQLKLEFGRDIVVTVLLKNLDGSDKVYRASVDNIDNHIPEKYSESDLFELISSYTL